MGHTFLYSSPEKAPTDPDILKTPSSSPWSDVLLEELQQVIHSHQSPDRYGEYGCSSPKASRTRIRSISRFIWLSIFLIVGSWWALRKGREPIHFLKTDKQVPIITDLTGLRFIEANDPNIRYVGRWIESSNGRYRDGSFPGVYFDIIVNGSRTVLISLRNTHTPEFFVDVASTKVVPRSAILPTMNTAAASPLSVLVRVDDDEYIVLVNASSVVPIRRGSLDLGASHNIRIIAPMVGGEEIETLQVDGIWLDEGGKLLPHGAQSGETNLQFSTDTTPSKTLEVVTDQLGWMAGRHARKASGTIHGILCGVMGWEYLLGEMFGVDHVTIGMDGMCLIEDCIGGREQPTGLADVFFQSGPAGSEHFQNPWHFQSYVPDVIVINIGNSDWESFQTHQEEYNKTLWDLSVNFEQTYISLIKAIRALAYPSTEDIPIFVMRPFRGQLEQATHSVVDRIQREGDQAIFWLDTSGWLNTEVDFDGPAEDQDFFLCEEGASKQWRLTERGHQRVAILLHMHVCRYLAHDVEKCAFLLPEVYQGRALDHDAILLDEYFEEEREQD